MEERASAGNQALAGAENTLKAVRRQEGQVKMYYWIQFTEGQQFVYPERIIWCPRAATVLGNTMGKG